MPQWTIDIIADVYRMWTTLKIGGSRKSVLSEWNEVD